MSTDLEAQERSEAAATVFLIQRAIIDAMAEGRRALWKLSEALYEFDEARGWDALGYETLSEWLAEPEVTITRGSYYRAVRTWRKLVVERQIDAERIKLLDQAKVAIITDKIASAEVTIDEAFADVESMPARDLREKYFGKREPAYPAQEVVPEDVADEPHDEQAALDAGAEWEELDEGTEPESEAVVGEVVDYERPPWMSDALRVKAREDLKVALYNSATFPRVSRSTCEVAAEALDFLESWLSTRQS